MANIQKTLDALQPYVISIRYVDGIPVVDTVFKDDWVLPQDKYIKRAKGTDELNYYMLYSEVEGYGIDDLLKYVERTIKLNQEREKKHELLIIKINELKELFKQTSLEKLTTLKFTFNEIDTLTPKLTELDVTEPFETDNDVTSNPSEHSQLTEIDKINETELTEEEKEILEEERRAEINRKLIAEKKNANKNKTKIELPPKQKNAQIANNYDVFSDVCECGENEACEKCIDTK